jgi:histone H3/H4
MSDEAEDEKIDVMVVQSKVKQYIREHGEMNTSKDTLAILSKAVERLCSRGIESAKNDKRKTVMARDIVIEHL